MGVRGCTVKERTIIPGRISGTFNVALNCKTNYYTTVPSSSLLPKNVGVVLKGLTLIPNSARTTTSRSATPLQAISTPQAQLTTMFHDPPASHLLPAACGVARRGAPSPPPAVAVTPPAAWSVPPSSPTAEAEARSSTASVTFLLALSMKC